MSKSADSYGISTGIDRRQFLRTTGALAASAIWASRGLGAVRRDPRFSAYPFSLGVASGDPSPTGFVLWTRLAPRPLEGGGMPSEPVEVAWQLADDDKMTKVLQKGTMVATPDWAHSVHVEVDGLEPDRWYFYQFRAGNEVSPVARTRTMPAVGSTPKAVRFATASCQHYEDGLYTSYEHMLNENLDLVLHLGDYIYETAPERGGIRPHVGMTLDSLGEFRNRHAQYKTDEHLQAMHAAAPWMVTWDDHELEDNYANDISRYPDVTRQSFLERRARAYKAYYEHMPLRRASLPNGPEMSLYRRVSFGQLADFFVLDTRQYRTDQPCGDFDKEPCPGVYDPKATILGDAQEKWLCDGLSGSKSVWNVLAQQVMMARVDFDPGPKTILKVDKWSGYEVNRRRLLKFFHDRKISNSVVLTGDIHSNWANNLIADFDNLDSQTVGVELVGTSISTGSKPTPKNLQALLDQNPFVKFHNAERGYVLCEVTPEKWLTHFRTVPYVNRPGAPLNTRASFIIEAGKPGLERA